MSKRADWVEGFDKKDKNKSELEEFIRKCNTKNNQYEKLYKDKYLGMRVDLGLVTRTYAGGMPFYNPILEVTLDNGTICHMYGE